MSTVDADLARLYRARPRSRFVRGSVVMLVTIVAYSWLAGDFGLGAIDGPRRLAIVERFLGELRPYPLQGEAFELAIAVDWAGALMAERGWAAARSTLAIAVASIVLAALVGLLLAPFAARNVASVEPFGLVSATASRRRRLGWRLVVASSRAVLTLVRSIPEYVLAFLLLAIMGPTAWPVVLALALHNAGILGKMTAEVVENLEPGPLAALRGLGATRPQIAIFGLFPLITPRFLLYFFYRWETCVREAMVLGMLGTVSLGYWIVDARARNHYDEMVFLVLVGAALVVVGDLLSSWLRGRIRRSG